MNFELSIIPHAAPTRSRRASHREVLDRRLGRRIHGRSILARSEIKHRVPQSRESYWRAIRRTIVEDLAAESSALCRRAPGARRPAHSFYERKVL